MNRQDGSIPSIIAAAERLHDAIILFDIEQAQQRRADADGDECGECKWCNAGDICFWHFRAMCEWPRVTDHELKRRHDNYIADLKRRGILK